MIVGALNGMYADAQAAVNAVTARIRVVEDTMSTSCSTDMTDNATFVNIPTDVAHLLDALRQRQSPARAQPPARGWTLALDLDETLVHTLPGGQTLVRPYAIKFLDRVQSLGFDEVVLFTAGTLPYASPIADALEATVNAAFSWRATFPFRFNRRLYRDACTFLTPSFVVKDLERVRRNATSRVILVDNTPSAYGLQPKSGLHPVVSNVGAPQGAHQQALRPAPCGNALRGRHASGAPAAVDRSRADDADDGPAGPDGPGSYHVRGRPRGRPGRQRILLLLDKRQPAATELPGRLAPLCSANAGHRQLAGLRSLPRRRSDRPAPVRPRPRPRRQDRGPRDARAGRCASAHVRPTPRTGLKPGRRLCGMIMDPSTTPPPSTIAAVDKKVSKPRKRALTKKQPSDEQTPVTKEEEQKLFIIQSSSNDLPLWTSPGSDDENIVVRLQVTPDNVSRSCLDAYNTDAAPHSWSSGAGTDAAPNGWSSSSSTKDASAPSKQSSAPIEFERHRIVDVLADFALKSQADDWPLSTSVLCYWCCHRFDSAPLGMPVRYVASLQKFLVTGCYCSLACAAAHNFELNRHSPQECIARHALLNALAQVLDPGRREPVGPAPPRLALAAFGGHMSIDHFRSCGVPMLLSCSPMRAISQQIEEVCEADMRSEYRYVPIDRDRVSKCQEKMRITRSKPLVNFKNTLDHTMKLKYGPRIAQPSTSS
ncbi:hypothetical protein CEUSTIGMA_g13145.t1 [Chlamydomonas eustigma]|uniref:FCP1 homology domain-containing protein n=1 Tax=Chlamydomonas eustigma TaxID=1157962 RepID=A0A250XSF4_9CHLO|nr:hypothetical protein CEUSTIGMA_g13145.t1 [Chlamydomonas eustigma]|eukprot:GAX85730.1 hypothetical protein CEUSTIGMA_g13145.t1 [Chlamydomonas eustigma]